ncbi:MAG: TRAP transporter large permease subunit [Candidatus Odyssella sp.]|nr:TRAP transporter large permease subunit [Candidatus Odyssella sp.]
MSNEVVGLLMLAIFVVSIFLGFPIAFTLLALGFGFGYALKGNVIFDQVIIKAYEVTTNDVLVAVPLFLFMGYVIERANILDRLFHSIQISARNLPGSLAVATLITCSLFATATGIVGAVVTLMGLLAFPAMMKAGYDQKLASGVVCAGGCLGILIPPSILLILYAAIAGTSAVRLYAGALIPGFMLAGLYIVYVIGRSTLNPKLAPKLPASEVEGIKFGQVVYELATSFFPLAILIMLVLGAIMFGWATPSEAAAVGALGSMVLAAAYGALTFQRIREAVYLTARATAMVCWLFVGSATFSSVLGDYGGDQLIAGFFKGLDLSPWQFMLISQVIIFLLGWPLEWTEILIIFVPIFLPLLKSYGIDPMLFGIMVALNIQTAFLSPPVAMACYYLKGVAPRNISINTIFAGSMPFMYIVFLSMAILYVFPELATWLPSYLYDTK